MPAGKLPYFALPVFNFFDGQLSCYYQGGYYSYTQRHAEVPRLTALQQEALDMFAALAGSDALRMDLQLQPGDMQLLHNHTMVHTRTAFEDHDEAARKRHLLRLWVAPHDARALPPVMAEAYGGSLTAGARGGVVVDGTRLQVAFEP